MNYFEKVFKKTLIIAEIGVNHNGSINTAIKLILAAKKAGADAAKFQTFNTEKLASIKTKKTLYQKRFSSGNESHFEMLKKLELSKNEFYKIKKICEANKLIFISTPYDVESAIFLDKIKTKIFKIASADIIDFKLNNIVAKFSKPTIISTGMSNVNEIEEIMNFYSKNKVALLHCVSNYPCSDKSLNLNCISLLKKKFNVPVGFSDHSLNNMPAAISVSLGAKIIEKHITLNKNQNGPDHKTSLNPNEFCNYIKIIRNTEIILGKYEKKLQKEEVDMKTISRKSIHYINNYTSNHKLKKNNFIFMRPGDGIQTIFLKNIEKKILKKNVKKFQKVKYSDFK
jgi:sialic acid synthase SpsE